MRIILKLIFKKWDFIVDCIHLVKWRVPVNTFINLATEEVELLHGFNSISSPINRLNKIIA
jgi:hypothetical protein